METDKKRRPNFTADELSTLTSSIARNTKSLFSRNNTVYGNSMRERTWVQVARDVSAVGNGRTVDEVKKKWTCLKSDAKMKAAGIKRSLVKTGGGPPAEDLTQMEEQIVSLMSRDAIDGIPGGIDTTVLQLPGEGLLFN